MPSFLKTLFFLTIAFFSSVAVTYAGNEDDREIPIGTMPEKPQLGAQNVAIAEVSYADLPDGMKAQAVRYASCVGGEKRLNDIKYYAYVSDFTRAKELPPNYIIDLAGLKNDNFFQCPYGRLCRDGMCHLVGYFVDDTGVWITSFSRLVGAWSIEDAPRTDPKAPQITWINLFYERDDKCKAMGGVNSSDGLCTYSFEWRPTGLEPVDRRK